MSLVELLKEKDDNAFCYMFEMYKKLLYTVADDILDNHDASVDVVYEVFTRVYANPERLDEKKNLKFYLTTMARNLAIDIKKKQQRYEPLNEDYLRPDETPNYKFQDYDRIIDKLSKIVNKRDLTILIMHYVDNLGFAEIAKILDLSYNQITGLAHRAKAKIKKNCNLEDFYD